MIHDWDYYSIVDKDNILSLMYDIDQKIICMCHQNSIRHNIMLSISLGQDPDTPTYMEELSSREDWSCEDFWKMTETFYIGSWIVLHKVEYWWCWKLSLYDKWWDYDRNVDTDEILQLMDEWDGEDCMDTPSTFHMRKYEVLKSQSHDPDTPKYMEALSGENTDGYFKDMDDKIQSLMRRDT